MFRFTRPDTDSGSSKNIRLPMLVVTVCIVCAFVVLLGLVFSNYKQSLAEAEAAAQTAETVTQADSNAGEDTAENGSDGDSPDNGSNEDAADSKGDESGTDTGSGEGNAGDEDRESSADTDSEEDAADDDSLDTADDTAYNVDGLTDEEKLAYIKSHKKKYPKRYRQLAQEYPETIDFVYQYPVLHDETPVIDLSDEAGSSSIPLLLQWDTRWGYYSYAGGDIGYTGCGPTCLSMVALYLTGNSKYTPLYIAEYAEEHGYCTEGVGTKWALMDGGASAFGLEADSIDTDKESLREALEDGMPVICSVKEGDFTDSGHFIVLTGYTDNGRFTLHDPNSVENSSKTWTYKRLAKQIRAAWSYKAAGDSNAAG